MRSIQQALLCATQSLAECGIESASLDSRLLFQDVLGVSHEDLILKGRFGIDDEAVEQFQRLIQRRADREPLAYIRGRKEFWSLEFKVTPNVLIPRPETELLVETTVKLIHKKGDGVGISIWDVGTGSGNIAIALAKEFPMAKIVASDISEVAIKVAKDNAYHLGVSNVEFKIGDCFEPFPKQWDIIVSNPPYVESSVLDRSVNELRYEPRGALDGGEDGLKILKHLLLEAKEYLNDGGCFVLEHGNDQQEALLNMIQPPLFLEAAKKDFQGHPRVLVAYKRGSAEGGI